jgi:DNA-directed RNA polymerase specialized sigma24 family protein
MTRRRLVDRLAREPIETAPSAEDDYLTTDVDDKTVEQFAQVRSAWQQLSESNQRVLAMDALGRSGPLIAAELGISHQAARSRLMRARGALFDAFGRLGTEPG